MKKIPIILFCLFTIHVFGQQTILDSLISVLPSQAGEIKVNSLNNIADLYHRNDEVKSSSYANEALILATKLGYKKGIIASYSNLSYSKLQESSYKESLDFSIKALKISESINDKHLTAEAYTNIANAYLNMFNFALADKNYLYAVKSYKELGDSLNVAIIYTNLAVSFDNREMLDSALCYYNKSFPIYQKIKNNKMYLGLWYTNVGDLYRKQKKYKEALEYQLKAEPLLIDCKDNFTLMVLYSGIPYTYIKMNELDKALEYAFKSVDLGISLNSRRELSYSYSTLADVYEAKNDFANQIKYLKRHIELNDSVLTEETGNTITEMQSKYESDKKEKEIEILNKNKALQAAQIEQHETKQIFYIGLVIFVLVLSIILAIGIKSKQKANNILVKQKREIELQKNLVEEKNKEISDSINYAERIQRSFLASKELLDENLKDYFVFYKPKDVVSGDFYCASKLNDGKFILATADSTGHGVPGAIMSLLNITSLEKGIENFTNPADILNYTRDIIIERLKKDGSSEGGKDGMDCSLIVFDFNANQLQIAAANNPVWIVRLGELIEIAPDKMSVGKNEKDNESFSLKTVEVKKGDVVYSLTDGFPDQFGGGNGKKFMSKRLKELLISSAHLPMNEQKQLLETTFLNWVGNLEQVDDVTIIGVRI